MPRGSRRLLAREARPGRRRPSSPRRRRRPSSGAAAAAGRRRGAGAARRAEAAAAARAGGGERGPRSAGPSGRRPAGSPSRCRPARAAAREPAARERPRPAMPAAGTTGGGGTFTGMAGCGAGAVGEREGERAHRGLRGRGAEDRLQIRRLARDAAGLLDRALHPLVEALRREPVRPAEPRDLQPVHDAGLEAVRLHDQLLQRAACARCSVKPMPTRAASDDDARRAAAQGTFALSLSSAVLRNAHRPGERRLAAHHREAAAQRPRVARQASVHRAEVVGEHPHVGPPACRRTSCRRRSSGRCRPRRASPRRSLRPRRRRPRAARRRRTRRWCARASRGPRRTCCSPP